MKKILMICFVLLLSATLFAAITATGKVGDLVGSPKTAEIKYTLALGSTDSFEVGFSTNAITALDTPVIPASDIALTPDNGAFIATNSSVYVYWKILSPINCNIYLDATSLILNDSPTNDAEAEAITLTISTAKGSSATDDGNAVTSGTTTDGLNNTVFTRIGGEENNLFSYNVGEDHQAAGSQKLTVTTGNFAGKTAGDYTAHLKLTIASV